MAMVPTQKNMIFDVRVRSVKVTTYNFRSDAVDYDWTNNTPAMCP
jgi:hypothetical protein